jgi:hypothetical protein
MVKPLTKIDIQDNGKKLIVIKPDFKITINGVIPSIVVKEIKKIQKSGKDMEFKDIVNMINKNSEIDISLTSNITMERNEQIYSFFMNFIRTLDKKGYKSIKADISKMKVEIIKNGKEIIFTRNDRFANFMVKFRKGINEPLPKEINIIPFTELIGCATSIYTGLVHYNLYEDLQKSLRESFKGYENYMK